MSEFMMPCSWSLSDVLLVLMLSKHERCGATSAISILDRPFFEKIADLLPRTPGDITRAAKSRDENRLFDVIERCHGYERCDRALARSAKWIYALNVLCGEEFQPDLAHEVCAMCRGQFLLSAMWDVPSKRDAGCSRPAGSPARTDIESEFSVFVMALSNLGER
jgi:hypothetical protein